MGRAGSPNPPHPTSARGGNAAEIRANRTFGYLLLVIGYRDCAIGRLDWQIGLSSYRGSGYRVIGLSRIALSGYCYCRSGYRAISCSFQGVRKQNVPAPCRIGDHSLIRLTQSGDKRGMVLAEIADQAPASRYLMTNVTECSPRLRVPGTPPMPLSR